MNYKHGVGDNSLRIWRSPYSNFYQEETLHAAEVYTQDYLEELAEAGFNAVWIHAYLREVAPTRVFPELGGNSAAHLRSLRTVVRRGNRAGIRVFLYMQPPMGMPAGSAFWRRHPEARGVTEKEGAKGTSAMCTSEPTVRAFLHEAAETLSRRLPGLGGAILITASEYLAHCYSHHAINPDFKLFPEQAESLGCPRCKRRHPREIIADVVGSIHAGFHAAGNGAEIIAWNWSWSMYEKDPQREIVDILPSDVTLMAGFERGGSKVILGKRRIIDEYALSYAGPSERFVGSVKAARRRGLKTIAKLQINTTHELGVAPNLPVIGSLYEKARAMRRLRLTSYMGCWNFGNMLTANTAAFTFFLTAKRLPPRPQALAGFARAYFPGCEAKEVVAGWELFADAMDHYPFCIPFLYKAPLTFAVAYPIEPGPLEAGDIGSSWRPMKRGDDLSGTFGPYTLEEIIKGLGALTRIWWRGVERFENGIAGCETPKAQIEVNAARMVGHCFHSGWNVYRAYQLRKKWSPAHLNALRAIMRDELDHLPDAHHITKRDRRMGFHSGSGFPSFPQQYFFTANSIRKKIKRLEELLHD
jgi:hypothetical protein